jgi:glycosyltransferase involved in cell wall biosynthesis
MRIAFLNKYQNKVYRGAETFVYELSRRLSGKYEVDVISAVNYLELFRKKYDVIIPINGRLQVILVRKICWLTGAKMVVSGQSGIGWDDRVNLYTFPNVFIALSKKAQTWAEKVNPFVRAEYISNGVDLEKFRPEGESLETGLKNPIVLAVGAFTKQKRMDLPIRAVAKLPGASLLMVGGGGELKEQITQYGLRELGKDRFKLMSVPYEKMPEVYRAADVFTLPSKPSESFGNVLVEAMATDLPVIAVDDPVRYEIVKEAGILTDPTDIDAYAGAIKKTLVTKWGDKPRRQAEKFSWDEITRKYEQLFEEIVK